MTLFVHRALMVVTAAQRAAANAAAVQLSGNPADVETFAQGLSPSGQEPATHYWSSALMTEGQWQALTTQLIPQFAGAHVEDWDLDTDPGRPAALLAELGLKRIDLRPPEA